MEIKRRVKQQAQLTNNPTKLTSYRDSKSNEKMFKLDSYSDEGGFKKVANYLLSSDVRRHNRYCPCCKSYDAENEELSSNQMGEFLDYIK